MVANAKQSAKLHPVKQVSQLKKRFSSFTNVTQNFAIIIE